MEVMDPRCCGLDVHKSSITACVLLAQSSKPLKHIRRFGCTTRELRELVVCLQELAVEHVAMESTGFMGSRCGAFSKATFKSCWPTHSILRQSPAQDGHQGLSVDRGTFAARTLAGQLHSPGADSRPARCFRGRRPVSGRDAVYAPKLSACSRHKR